MLKPTIVSNNTITRADFLERQPKNLRDFYADILKSLPSNLLLTAHGISKKSPAGHEKQKAFVSPFRVTGRLEEPKSENWSRVIELLNPAGKLVDCVIGEGVLAGRPRDAITELANKGLHLVDEFDIPLVLRLIRNWPVPQEAHLRLIEQVGWVPDRDAFILTSGRVITRVGSPTKYRFGGDANGKEIGDLNRWKEGVAALAPGNPNLVFGIALGFSSALMSFTELNTIIFHFFGRTSKGKTRLLRVALSVWPRVGSKDRTWEGTANGLEGEIAKSNSILMGLDELRADATPDLPAIIYKFANSSTKARGKKEGGSHHRITWNTAVISTGEYSFAIVVKTLGVLPAGGQGVRMLDIPVEGTYGVFDDLHGFDTSDDFVFKLDKVVKKASGPAGAAFIEQMLTLTDEELEEALEADLRTHIYALQQHLGVVAGDDKTAEIRRVITSFALVAIAGEWATKWGLTGWKSGAASEAVKTVARRWLDNRLDMPMGQAEEIKKVRDYLVANEAHFVMLSDAQNKLSAAVDGYQDDTFFYVLPAALTDRIGDKSKVLKALIDGGYLEKGGEDKSFQFRLPAVVPNRPRVYRIRRTILDVNHDIECPSDQSQSQE
jgi:putative DNA primase/helicase